MVVCFVGCEASDPVDEAAPRLTIEPGAAYKLSVALPPGVVDRQFSIELRPAGADVWRPIVPGVTTNVGVAKGCLRVRVSDGAPFDAPPSTHVTAPVVDCSLSIEPGVVRVVQLAKIDRIMADSFLGDPSVTFRVSGQDAPVLRTRMSLSRSGYDPTLPELYLPANHYWVSFAREPGESYVAGVYESAPALRLRLETPWKIDVRFEGEATLPDAAIDPPCEFAASYTGIDQDERTLISRPGTWRMFQKAENGAALRYVTVSCGPDRVEDHSLAPEDPTGATTQPIGTIARRHSSELGPSWRLALHRLDIAHPVRAGVQQPGTFALYRKSLAVHWRAQMKRPIATGVGMYVPAGEYQLVTRHADGSVTTDSFTIED